MTQAITTQQQQRAGKYLACQLAGEDYGITILQVREIIRMMEITAVPQMPPFVRGVINLRGKVVPVLDLRTRFGMPAAENGPNTCIVVVRIGGADLGIIVDSVREVADLPAAQIEDVPSFGAGLDTRFLLGIGKIGGRIMLLLDIDRVLTSDETRLLAA